MRWTKWMVTWLTVDLFASKWLDTLVLTEIPDANVGEEEEEEDMEGTTEIETAPDLDLAIVDEDLAPGPGTADADREIGQGVLKIGPDQRVPRMRDLGPKARETRTDRRALESAPRVRRQRQSPPVAPDLDPTPKAAAN